MGNSGRHLSLSNPADRQFQASVCELLALAVAKAEAYGITCDEVSFVYASDKDRAQAVLAAAINMMEVSIVSLQRASQRHQK